MASHRRTTNHRADGQASDSPRARTEFTEKFRRGAVLGFPIAALMHFLFTYAVWPTSGVSILAIIPLLAIIGLALRLIRRAAVVLAIGSLYFGFFFVYALGIAPSIAFLHLGGHKDWLPWAPLASALLLLSFLTYRVRLSLSREWSQPLDSIPGIRISRAEASIWREFGLPELGLSRVAIAMLLVFVPTAYFTYNSTAYLFVVLVMAMQCLALLTTCVVAWWVSYFIAVFRWERAAGLRLRLPALPLWS